MKLQNSSFQVAFWKRMANKCIKLQNASAKRSKLLVFIVKYANMWRSSSRLPSSLKSFQHGGYNWGLKVPFTTCKASRTTINIAKGRIWKPKVNYATDNPSSEPFLASNLWQVSPCSCPNALHPSLSSFSFILSKAENSRNNHPCMNFAYDGGMCQKSLLITMEDSRSESLIF